MGQLARLANVRLLTVSLLVGLGLAEAGLRIADISYPEFVRLGTERGWAPRPGVEGWWTREGRAYNRINGEGFRDRAHSIAKPARSFRIAILGDSYAAARAVPVENTFWSVLERRLSNCPALGAIKPEVLNFGVSGYGTAQELMTLRNHVWKYQPDVVLMAFYTGNDVFTNSRELEGHTDRPYLALRDGLIEVDDSFRETDRYRWKSVWQEARHSLINGVRVVQLVKEAYYRVKYRASGSVSRAGLDVPSKEDGVYLAPKDPVWQRAWEVTEEALRLMRDEVRAN